MQIILQKYPAQADIYGCVLDGLMNTTITEATKKHYNAYYIFFVTSISSVPSAKTNNSFIYIQISKKNGIPNSNDDTEYMNE